MSRISPYGTSPSLISAWNPLQMPHISPSRFLSSSMTASRTAGPRRNAVINLADPSGSSPPEKPPGSAMICARPTASAKAAALSAISAAVRLRTTKISACAPARSKARAVSYSQFVPGNTGISTRGRATDTAARCGAAGAALYTGALPPVGLRYGNTGCNRSSHSSWISSSGRRSKP